MTIAFADAPNKVYVVDNRASDADALSLLDLDSGAVQELFHDPRVDLDRAALAEPDRVLYAARYFPPRAPFFCSVGELPSSPTPPKAHGAVAAP